MANPDWKDHPIAIAAIAVATSIGLCVLVGKEIILPTYTASLNNTIEELQSKLKHTDDDNKSLINKAEALTKKLTSAGDVNKDLLSKLESAQYEKLFSNNDPYPVGLGGVKIGDPVTSIFKIYPKDSITVDKVGYVEVKNQHKIFDEVIYYVDEENKNLPITHILFRINYTSKLSNEFLQKKLIDSFGLPEEWEWKDYYSWPTSSNSIIYKEDGKSFILMQQKYTPAAWPKRKSCSQLTKN